MVADRFRLFLSSPPEIPAPDLEIRVHHSERAGYLPIPSPPECGSTDPAETYKLETRVSDGRVHAWSYCFSGSFEIDGDDGELSLCESDYEPPARSVENFLRVALAWKAVSRGALLLHAGGAVHEGLAYVFFGPSGSGKTTITRLLPEALVLNDDVILLRPIDGGLAASGVPFKGAEDLGARHAGEFPIAGLFRLVQDKVDACERLPASRAASEIAASIPFVTERPEGLEKVFPLLEKIVRSAPVFRLRFRRSADFWPVLQEALRAAGPRTA